MYAHVCARNFSYLPNYKMCHVMGVNYYMGHNRILT